MTKRWPFDRRVRDLLVRFLGAARQTGKPYAIGGALAMSAHGYTRQTTDVDAFVLYADRGLWGNALRAQGLSFSPVFPGVHYTAGNPAHASLDIRIDLVVPADDPELSAVECPEKGEIGGIHADVFPMSLLVIAKSLSERDVDHADVDAMYERGLFDPREVARVMRRVDSRAAKLFLRRYAG